MQPRAHKSDYGPQKSSSNSYGAMYKGVPTKVARRVVVDYAVD